MKKLFLLLLICSAMTVITAAAISAGEGVFHGGDVIYTVPVKSVIFSHAAHVEEMGMGCDMCHPDTFEMSNLAAQEYDDFTMQAMKDGKYCGACHNGSWAFASDSQCARCHIGVKGYNALTRVDESEGNSH